MELLDRYLRAVKFWLPKAQKRDIIAELSEDIRSQIEDRETELGRRLDEAEQEALLRKRGNPMFVAGRYSPPKQLIGPTLFPVYKFILKILVYGYLLPGAAVWLFMALFIPSYRADHPGGALYIALLNWLWSNALTSFALITGGFAVMEKLNWTARWETTWNLRGFPAVCDTQKIPRSSSLGNIAGPLFWAVWWIGVIKFPALMIHTGETVQAWTGGTLWRSLHRHFFWTVLALLLAEAAFGAFNLFRPYWTRKRLACGLALNASIALFLFVVVKINWHAGLAAWLSLNVRRSTEFISAKLDAFSNVLVVWIIAAIAIGYVVGSLVMARRYLRFNTRSSKHVA